MSKLPAPIESPVEFPGDRHAPEYTREELAALLSVKRGDQFRWRGDHYIATDDASEDSCNGWRRVFIKACACNPAMPSGWSLADITASRKIAPTSAEAPPAIVLRQTRNADGASVLVPAGDRPDPESDPAPGAESLTVESVVLGCARINLRAELARIAAEALADIERGASVGGTRGAIAVYNAATGAALQVTLGRCPVHSGERITAFNAACRVMGIEPARRTAILVDCEPDAESESLLSAESGDIYGMRSPLNQRESL